MEKASNDGETSRKEVIHQIEMKIEGKEAWKNFEEQSISHTCKKLLHLIYIYIFSTIKDTNERREEKKKIEQSTIESTIKTIF